MVITKASIIVPTYREVENLSPLIDRIAKTAEQHGLDLELLIVDDDSNDGTVSLIESRNLPWVRLHVRRGPRDLGRAVTEGFALARHPVLIVMDGDLSHPPQSIPDMLAMLSQNYEFVIGSRYAPGGSIEARWGALRRLNSRVAGLLARPLTAVSDPMSGFFALSRDVVERAGPIGSIGYKIGLELLVRGRVERVGEVPIHFANRRHGKSKLNFAQRWRYVKQIVRLWGFKLRQRYGLRIL
jgi:dolichol-phosphate mannosyltransferase